MSTLKDKTIFITGSTRGIGLAIALRCAKDGANIVITGKTTEKHESLPGTIYTAAEEVEKAGGQALPLMLDVRDEKQIESAVAETVKKFGGIDILINNASAISLTNTEKTTLKRFDLMMGVNARATFACSRACIPYLMKSHNPHILTMSPPLHMVAKWFKDHLVYTYSKYGMSVCTLGMSAEFKEAGIAVNSLWPKTTIATAAIKVNFPPELYAASRNPEIVANAAYWILTQNSRETTGQFFIDEAVLAQAGEKDFSRYNMVPGVTPMQDLFLE
ncbi:MAG: short chain dehydrogenase [Gammaproteobacteria bacterium CG_4_10_14_0_8_um_filter_38_16]|nr:MAG: short chain dehydrogenase [Gammaproteobacteria bacterium CG_4_10_14_0_8_um_filter_38_16]PJA03346.1 MAG: short chain dehydrogenase [Gammaproteobacteria bacterium CG_4_10_14_0_2_um_filter_38_22]PJB10660.1 MAG: short chain dehydrogenase [Gammaproteobacteria bacterium CG_4_9_14_3_um_filter_38_9]